jgi:hypothetical protein
MWSMTKVPPCRVEIIDVHPGGMAACGGITRRYNSARSAGDPCWFAATAVSGTAVTACIIAGGACAGANGGMPKGGSWTVPLIGAMWAAAIG